ncbi:MAG TPA: hypothetical protein VK447_10850 [Myxococcaceae bacterium]|nr:hypothetical protein [Myxococcaceae bacterium]
MIASAPDFDPSLLPSLDPERAKALLPAIIERVMRLELSVDEAQAFFTAFLERLIVATGGTGQVDESWRRWFEFCDSFEPSSAQSYLDILEDPDRW